MYATSAVPKPCVLPLVAAAANSVRAKCHLVAIGIMAAICGTVSYAVAKPRGGPSAMPAEWLAAIEKQATAERGTWDAAWHDVMRGAAMAMEPYEGRPEAIAKPSGQDRRLYNAYPR